MEMLYPLRFHPVYKNYIWGGDRIPGLFHRNQPAGVYAESWEISTHPDGMTVIANGPLGGRTLQDILPGNQTALLGTHVRGGDFPLLIKLIDARDTLSVQVHPNDGNAAAVSGEPKTEMWYFLEGDGSAQVYCGLKPGVGKSGFLEALANKTFSEILQSVPARKGEAVFVPGGCVHAIGAGCLILEIQQNSNTTYRIYDWDRADANGRSRELHIDKAMQVIDWGCCGDPRCKASGTRIQTCEYFCLERVVIQEKQEFFMPGTSFDALFVAEGSGAVLWEGGEEKLSPGQSWLIPAALGSYTIVPDRLPLTLLRITVP